jgi:hypothetical protein
MHIRTLLIYILLLLSLHSFAQKAVIFGKVYDQNDKPISGVTISHPYDSIGVKTIADGTYKIYAPISKTIILTFSYKGDNTNQIIPALNENENKQVDIAINIPDVELGTATIRGEANRNEPIIDVKPANFDKLTTATPNIEGLLKSMGGGVSSSNELSSTYNVRGGNFDENLVYVNDVEIYRPQLVRSGQQEGLSFTNPDMVEKIKFSAGGFDAKYGDKMSSVLDIQYKKPKKFAASANVNFMGAMLSLEGRKNRFSYIIGARYRDNSYLLNSLDTKGDYRPRFADLQGYFNYDVNSTLSVNLLVTDAYNRYLSAPQSQTTQFGTAISALQLQVGFLGQQITRYNTQMTALSTIWSPAKGLTLKLIGSAYRSKESEYFDLIGYYKLSDLDNDLGSPQYGQVKSLRGYGVIWDHGRNDLNVQILNISHKGNYITKKVNLNWGAGIQEERVHDKMREWGFNDSADFIVPYKPGPTLVLNRFLNVKNDISSYRTTGYIQNTTRFKNPSITLNYGARLNHWTFNGQTVISPRVQFSWEPNKIYNRKFKDSLYSNTGLKPVGKLRKDILYRLSGGYYYQPPFYRELKDLDGVVHNDVKAQRSIHIVAGGDLNFKAWNRPFKFVTEVYYKKYDFLVPYDIDNVKLRYWGANVSQGYATGIDLRLNGEFIPTLESWASLSFMKTSEQILSLAHWRYTDSTGAVTLNPERNNPSHKYDSNYVTWFPRPTDQRFTFNIFFQDYLPKFPTYRMSLNLVVGGALPTGPPNGKYLRNAYRLNPYRRVDIGFSKILIDEHTRRKTNFTKRVKSMWLSFEVFNLLQFNNAVSYIWVQDLTSRNFAVPNYLTSRRINLHLVMKF